MTRPTPEQIAEARAEWNAFRTGTGACPIKSIDVLYAATEPLTDEQIVRECVISEGCNPDSRVFARRYDAVLSDIRSCCSWSWSFKAAQVIRRLLGPVKP
jgi:hypothetical protein